MYLSGIVVTLNDVAGLYAFDAEFAIPIIRWRWRWRCINSCVLNCNGYLPINIKGCGRIHFQKQPATQLADGVLLSSNNPSTLGAKDLHCKRLEWLPSQEHWIPFVSSVE